MGHSLAQTVSKLLHHPLVSWLSPLRKIQSKIFGIKVIDAIYLGFPREYEADFEDGYDDERDHLRLPLFNEEAIASEEDGRVSEDAITAELRIHTASSTIWRSPRFSNAEHSM